ncbi:MAG: M20/M25/M40 family metallo-hydrolase [Cytophagales bacterium]|nr:M20/M25/M40 family metallo-hydrolase [Armatimonadota bacterium]
MPPIAVNEPRVVDTFLTLCRFNTPSRSEKAASEWAGAYLEKLGFTVEWDDAGKEVGGTIGNLIAFKKGTVPDAPPIFFSSHLDTVEATPGLEIAVEGNLIRSASDTILGADDKCGVAPILEAMALLTESGEPHGDIQLLLMICEEIGLVGAKLLDPSRIKARYGFVLDSGPPMGGLTYTAPSQNSLKVRIEGKPSHAGSSPEKGVSAILAAAKAIAAMTLGRIDSETTANIGVIHGGTARNIVPAEVELVGEARSRTQAKLDAQTAHMKEVFEREAAALGAVAHVEVIEEYRTYHLTESDPVIRIGSEAARRIGLTPVLRPSGGGSDGNIFNGYGFPTTVLACGMEQIHTHDEFCTISALVQDAQWVVEIVRATREFRA